MPKRIFDHERLNVYHESLRFVAWVTERLMNIPKSLSVHDQLDRASTSIPLNIAEGSGKFTVPDRCRFYDNARGSALGCAAALDVLIAKKLMLPVSADEGKAMLLSITAMLIGLLRSVAPDRVCEDSPEYGGGVDAE